MTIDIDELRNDAKTAHFGHTPLEVPGSEMLELLDRLSAAEKDITVKEEVIDSLAAVVKRLDAQCDAAEAECLEQARLNGMGGEREAALLAKLEAAKKDRANFLVEMGRLCAQCDALRAKVAEMEKQEPVAWMHETST